MHATKWRFKQVLKKTSSHIRKIIRIQSHQNTLCCIQPITPYVVLETKPKTKRILHKLHREIQKIRYDGQENQFQVGESYQSRMFFIQF